MRAVLGVVVCLLAMPVRADGTWRVMLESSAESVSIDFDSLQRTAGLISFHERRIMRDAQTHPNSLRPVREMLFKRVVDCRAQRMATLSRAVFSDDDALIDHQATRLNQAVWQPVASGDPVFKQVCGRS